MLANHGRLEKYTHQIEGHNSRLDGLQAAILRVKLRHLDEWNQARRQHADFYLESLTNGDLNPLTIHEDAEAVWHLFVVRVSERETFQQKLKEEGIATGVHYPVPLHLQPAYEHYQIPPGSFPITERVAKEVVSLPMYPELAADELESVVNAITMAYARV